MPQRVQDLTDLSTFGTDGSIGLYLTRPIRGVRVVLEHVARRWLTSPGEHPADPTMILDLMTYINNDPSDSDLRKLPARLDFQAARVQFVKRCKSTVRFVNNVLTVKGDIDIIGAGEFPLVVKIQDARLVASFGVIR
jgi:hypothetical protein